MPLKSLRMKKERIVRQRVIAVNYIPNSVISHITTTDRLIRCDPEILYAYVR